MKGAASGIAVSLFVLLGGCLGSPAEGPVPPVTKEIETVKPITMYIVATDSGSPFSEGIYKFRPATFAAKTNDLLNITIKNAVGNMNNHNLVIPDLGVTLPSVRAGESASTLLNVTKTGTFDYYCSIGQHRSLGMQGKLTIS